VIGNYGGVITVHLAGIYFGGEYTGETATVMSGGSPIRVLVDSAGFVNFGGYSPTFETTNCTGQAYILTYKQLAPVCTLSPSISNNSAPDLPKITVYCPGNPVIQIVARSYRLSEDPTHQCYKNLKPYYSGPAGAVTPVTLSYQAPFTIK
jgi:hypothetical protein